MMTKSKMSARKQLAKMFSVVNLSENVLKVTMHPISMKSVNGQDTASEWHINRMVAEQ